MASLPYHEPDITTLLVQSSFIFLLNMVNSILDKALYCGLLGQVLLGIAWGAPGAHILSDDAQHVIVQLGYLGLILLVYEGGLSVPIASLKTNLALSLCVALIGVAAPIATSFILMPLMDATPLQAFAAGAALCSTSLGTTFTVLSTSGLAQTRLGVVLGTAAMIDDVIGLVVVQVISNLGTGIDGISASIVVRPLLVSLAFAIVVPLVCKLLLREAIALISSKILDGRLQQAARRQEARIIVQLLVLFGFVAAGSYAGTSNLFTAYLAGAVINWWDTADNDPPSQSRPGDAAEPEEQSNDGGPSQASAPEGPAPSKIATQSPSRICGSEDISPTALQARRVEDGSEDETEPRVDQACLRNYALEDKGLSGRAMYEEYLAQPVHRLLIPFFFASIGFSIPIASLFKGPLLWRGLVYAILMALGKVVCGLWLLNLPWARRAKERTAAGWLHFCHLMLRLLRSISDEPGTKAHKQQHASHRGAIAEPSSDPSSSPLKATDRQGSGAANLQRETHAVGTRAASVQPPLSLYPAAILGSAMIARGEIGFLIASVAESKGIWQTSNPHPATRSSVGSSAIFIVVTWAIFICTLLGPIIVGLLVRRVKALEKSRQSSGTGGRDVLGPWRMTNM